MAKRKSKKEEIIETVEETVEETVVEVPVVPGPPVVKDTSVTGILVRLLKDTGLTTRGHRFGKFLVSTKPIIGGYEVESSLGKLEMSTLEDVARYIAEKS